MDLTELEERLRDLERQELKTSGCVASASLYTQALALPNNAWATINYNTVLWDPYAAITTGPGWIWVSPFNGYVWVYATLMVGPWYALNTGELIVGMITQNGAEKARPAAEYNFGSGSMAILKGGTLLKVARGDGVRFYVYQNSGSNLTTYAGSPNDQTNQIHLIKV